MRVQKRILEPDRLRKTPSVGFSWVDRRFMRDFARKLSRDGVLLYFFLAAVSDKHGLSFYGDEAMGRILGMTPTGLHTARNDLRHWDLIAYEPPLYQVLSMEAAPNEAAYRSASMSALLLRLANREGRA